MAIAESTVDVGAPSVEVPKLQQQWRLGVLVESDKHVPVDAPFAHAATLV